MLVNRETFSWILVLTVSFVSYHIADFLFTQNRPLKYQLINTERVISVTQDISHRIITAIVRASRQPSWCPQICIVALLNYLNIRLPHASVSSAYETDFPHSLPASYQLPTNALPTPYQTRPSFVPIERTTNGDAPALAESRDRENIKHSYVHFQTHLVAHFSYGFSLKPSTYHLCEQ